MSVTKIACPSCGVTLKTDKPLPAGKEVRCPKCKTAFSVPGISPAAATQVDRPARTTADRSKPIEQPAAPARASGPTPAATHPDSSAKAAPTRGGSRKAKPGDEDEGEPLDVKPAKGRRRKKGGLSLLQAVVAVVALAVVIGSAVVATSWWLKDKNKQPELMGGPVKPLAHERDFIPSGPPPANLARETAFDKWLQDFDAAKRQAAAENKDVLIFFDGSDWCALSKKLDEQVFLSPRFHSQMQGTFVPVYADFPDKAKSKAKVQDAARNERLAQSFGVIGFPMVVLADRDGKPYAVCGYAEGLDPDGYCSALQAFQQRRGDRDGVLSAVDRSQGEIKVRAAVQAANFLQHYDLLGAYGAELVSWLRMAETEDPKNEKGYVEKLFFADWMRQLQATKADNPEELLRRAALLEDWKKTYRFKDPDDAIIAHLVAGEAAVAAGRFDVALKYVEAARAYKPKRPGLERALKYPMSALANSSGTGFAVADGLILTNYHVVKEGGRILVVLPGAPGPAQAEVIATDETRDMALVHLKGGAGMRPLPLAPAAPPLQRGSEAAAFGYPLGDTLGGGVKLTRGAISAVPEPGNDNMIVLDLKVNPGNSGGPLCDTGGNVLGMITRKTMSSSGFGVDSYGMALPAPDLRAFLAKHVKARLPAPTAPANSWADVDRAVSPSVFMILQTPTQFRVFGEGRSQLTLEPRKH